MKITIIVGGRFHAFDLAYQLQNKKINFKLITSYPKFIVKKFLSSCKRRLTLNAIFCNVIVKYLFQKSL